MKPKIKQLANVSSTRIPPKSARTPLKRSDPCMEVKTRTGRVVVKPQKLKDFVKY